MLLALVLGGCSAIDPPPDWLTGNAPLPPPRPEISGLMHAPSLPTNAVPERPIPPVTVEEREQLRSQLTEEAQTSDTAAAPIRADMGLPPTPAAGAPQAPASVTPNAATAP